MELAIALAAGVAIGFFITKYFKDREIKIIRENTSDKSIHNDQIIKTIESSVEESTSKAQKPYFDELTKKEQRIATAEEEVKRQKQQYELKEREIMRMHSEANIKKNYSNISRGADAEQIMQDIILSSGFVKGKNVEFRKTQDGITGTPDATLIYPRERKVICDAKAPLAKFDEIVDAGQAGNESMIEKLKSEFGERILNHIDWLSNKGYHKARNSMNFTMMFLPSETHRAVAEESVGLHQKDMNDYAIKNKIVIVSPNTFYPYVEKINELWQLHENVKSADEALSIVKEAFKAIRIISEKISNVIKKSNATVAEADDLKRSFNSTFKRASEKVRSTNFSDDNLDKVVDEKADIIDITNKKSK